MAHDSMDWVDGFYSATGTWWGQAESAVTERDHRRLATMERLAGRSGERLRVLELGSSYGNTAFVAAQAGHDVIGVELSDRIDFTRRFAIDEVAGNLQFVKADFYDFELEAPVDVVTYWNGFGIGSDADQRRLLRRMIECWLKPDGIVLMDVSSPARWIQWAGDEEHKTARPNAGYPFNVSERTDYDPIGNRFIDTWWRTESPDEPVSQDLRCYAPADLLLLLEGTGLRLRHAEVEGIALDLDGVATSGHPLWRNHEYLVELEPER
ncbi:MAG TPA: class I SAM-dependent methyltransferase [Thermomicrobiales bacterium]|nr:class I SAM-dependent methyltransferase [Thermomicrobiales bacterium]